MNFCSHCSKRLIIREEINDNKRDVFYFCPNTDCKYKIKCSNYRITHKVYHHQLNNKTHLNKYKVKDITLPKKKTKCPNCKEKNFNRYEPKFFHNTFFINNICSVCFYNW